MSKHITRRRANGQYRKPTLERDFGITCPICPHCQGCNPHGVTEPAPVVCGQCGKPMTLPDITVQGRGKLTGELRTDSEGVIIRIEDDGDEAFWAETRLTLTQLRDLVMEIECIAADAADELRDRANTPEAIADQSTPWVEADPEDEPF